MQASLVSTMIGRLQAYPLRGAANAITRGEKEFWYADITRRRTTAHDGARQSAKLSFSFAEANCPIRHTPSTVPYRIRTDG